MDLIILMLLGLGIYALHKDHLIMAESLDNTTKELNKIIKHLDTEEEE